MKVMIINGPNLNMLGIRNPDIYGSETLEQVENRLCENQFGVEVAAFRSNSEGELIDYIQSAYGNYDGIIINAGAYSHYSYAIRDAIESVSIPCVEVHISNIYAREEFRHTSVISPVCVGTIAGLGTYGYDLALQYLVKSFKGE